MKLALSLFIIALPLLHSRQFNDPFTIIKWLFVHVSALLILGGKILNVPWPKKLPRWVIILALLSLNGLFKAYYPAILDKVSFIILVVLFLNYKIKDGPIIIPALLVVAYLFAQSVGHDFLGLSFGSRPTSSFGNINMLAQFAGLSYCWLFYRWPGVVGDLRSIVLGTLYAVVFYSGCRSVFLATTIASIFFIYCAKERGYATGKILIFGFLAFTFLKVSGGQGDVAFKFVKEKGQLETNNGSSLQIRKSLWGTSLKLFRDNPLGIGASRFEYSDVRYREGSSLPNDEFLVYNNPHNEFIRYLIEEGIQYFILLLAFIIWVARGAGARQWGLLSFMFVESFFQFPLMNACGFVFFALFLAEILRERDGMTFRIIRVDWPYKAIFAAIIVFFVGAEITSYWITANKPTNRKALTLACRLNPFHWRACVLQGIAEREAGKYFNANETLNRVLVASPNNYPAIQHKLINYFKKGLLYDGCFEAWRYLSILENKSILASDYQKYCLPYEAHFKESYEER